MSSRGKRAEAPATHRAFSATPDGALAIPGSTIRGLTRENMQILSFAPVRVGEDIAENKDSGRKGYKFPIADGLPPKYKELVDAGPLDCPSAILGFPGAGWPTVPASLSATLPLKRARGKARSCA